MKDGCREGVHEFGMERNDQLRGPVLTDKGVSEGLGDSCVWWKEVKSWSVIFRLLQITLQINDGQVEKYNN